MEKLATGITTQDRQIERSDSYRKTYLTVNDVEQITFTERLRGSPAIFARIIVNTNATMKYKKSGEEERDFDEGLTANIASLWRNENLEWIKIYPAAYPAIITVFSSGYSPDKKV
jgi:hypothetical protein